MAQITFNAVNKHRYINQNDEDQSKVSPSCLRDSLLKRILSNHLRSSVGVDDCIKNRCKFVTANRLDDSSSATKGLVSYDVYKDAFEQSQLEEILRSCSLSQREIDFLTNLKNDCDIGETYTNMLTDIECKLNTRQLQIEDTTKEEFAGAVGLNRHQYEEELANCPSDLAQQLTKCLVKLQPHKDPTLPQDHPMNNLKSLVTDLFPTCSKKDRKRKRKTESNQLNKVFITKPTTFWDMKEKPCDISKKGLIDSGNPAHIISEPTKTTDYSQPFVWPLATHQLLPLDIINNNIQSIDEIKKNPKFSLYNPGVPSSTLYIKNLPHRLDPVTLVSLFGHFEEQNQCNIEYRVLKGKMRGQAFVKFRSADVADKALMLCNGFVIEGKPIVVEFGKM